MEPPGDVAAVLAAWPEVLAQVLSRSKVAHTLVDGTVPLHLQGRMLVVAHPEASRLDFLRRSGGHQAALVEAVRTATGLSIELDLVLQSDAPVRTMSSDMSPTTSPTAAAGDPGTGQQPSGDTTPGSPSGGTGVEGEELSAPDDPDADEGDVAPLALVQRELGGSVLDEYDRP